MKLGFYTYSYIDRLGMSIESVLEKVAATGYDGVDVSATWREDLDPALFPREARQTLRRTAEQLGLNIEACVTHLPLVPAVWNSQPLNLPGAVDLAVELGAKIVTVHLGRAGDGCVAWRTAVKTLRAACAYAEQRGIVVATDAVWRGTILDTPEKVVQLIEDVGSPALKHNFDPCYLNICGFDPAEATAMLAPHIVHVHVKDYRGRYPHFEHLIPGDDGAEMNHAAWVRALHAAGFDGYAVVECFTHHPLERACAIGYRAMRRALERGAGF
ncbi:MAG: sugar phosphate isomerase/epimerase [Abditibacteriales bacterium]|nr:sugar phosphate isomerase/epimerase [Abditibacteriales bacterium]